MAAVPPATTYEKLGGAADGKGTLYEMKMFALVYARAVNSHLIFQLGANVKDAVPLDDIVIQFKPAADPAAPWTTLCVQLKHKLNAGISMTNLKSTGKDADFSIYKYFKGFLVTRAAMSPDVSVKKPFFDGLIEGNFCAIFTNAKGSFPVGRPTAQEIERLKEAKPVKKENVRPGIAETPSPPKREYLPVDKVEELLCTIRGEVFTFQPGEYDTLCDVLVKAFKEEEEKENQKKEKENLQKKEKEKDPAMQIMKDLERNDALKGVMRDYLSRLKVFHTQSNERGLDYLIKDELKKYVQRDGRYGVNFEYFYSNYMKIMEDFFESKEILNEASEVFSMAWNKTVAETCSSCDEILTRLESRFKHDELVKEEAFSWPEDALEDQFVLIESSEISCRMTATKLLQILQDEYLIFRVKSLLDGVFGACIASEWKRGKRKTLVITCDDAYLAGSEDFVESIEVLRQGLSGSGKRIIIIANSGICSAFKTKFPTSVLRHDLFEFTRLLNETQERILNSVIQLNNHDVHVKTVCQGHAASLLIAHSVVEILVAPRRRRVEPEKEIYIDRTLERVVFVKPSVFQESALRQCLIVLGSSLEHVQSVLLQADASLSPADVEATLHEEHGSAVASSFRLGKFECQFVARSPGIIVAVRMRIATEQSSTTGWFVFVFQVLSAAEVAGLCKCHDIQHLLRLKDGKVEWIKSCHAPHRPSSQAGDEMRVVRDHLDHDDVVALRPHAVTDVGDRLVFICAEPGIGKSTLVARLAKQTEQDLPYFFVIAISLNQHTHLLADEKFADVFEFLKTAAGIESMLEQSLMRRALEDTGNIIVVLDGFDEVSHSFSKECCALLSALLQTKAHKVWMTSRKFMQNELEDHGTMLSLKLRKFDEKDQRKFFEQFLEAKGVEKSLREHFIKDLLDQTKTAISEREQEMLGTPLLSRMMAEVFVDFVSDRNQMLTELKKMGLPFLLREFINKQQKIYFRDKLKVGGADEALHMSSIDGFTKLHTHFAIEEIVGAEDMKKFDLKPELNAKESRLFKPIAARGEDKTGVIDGIVNGKPRFVHRVFAEYFVAKWIEEKIKIWQSEPQLYAADARKMQCLLRARLFTGGWCVVRVILDRILAEGLPLHVAVLNEDVAAMRASLTAQDIAAEDPGGRTALHLAAALGASNDPKIAENRGAILDLLLTSKADVNAEDKVLKLGPIQYADKSHSWPAVDRLLGLGQRDNAPLEETRRCLAMQEQGSADDAQPVELVRCIVHYDLFHLLELSLGLLELPRGQNTFKGRLRDAIDRRSLLVAELLAEKDPSIDAQDEAIRDVFHIALRDGHEDVAVALIDRAVDIETPLSTSTNPTPLIFASERCQEKVVRALLNKLAVANRYGYVNNIDALGKRAIDWAAKSGNLTIVTLLFEAGSRLTRGHHETPLQAAARKGHTAVVEYLLHVIPAARRSSYVNKGSAQGACALLSAVERGHTDVARLLLSHGADARTALHQAVETNRTTEVEYFLSLVPDESERVRLVNAADEHGNTAVHSAAEMLYWECVEILVNAGGSLTTENNKRQTPLMLVAASGGRSDVLRLVAFSSAAPGPAREGGAFVKQKNSVGRTALHVAAEKDNVEAVAALIELGAEVAEQDADGRTALHVAAQRGHVKTLDTLLGVAGLVNLTDGVGNTALHLAAVEGSQEIVRMLVEAGAAVDMPNAAQETPAILAAMNGREQTLEYLLSLRDEQHSTLVNVNRRDADGLSGLHHASRKRHTACLTLLLEHGADLRSVDLRGRTPLHHAASRGDRNGARLLLATSVREYMNLKDNAGSTAVADALKDGCASMLRLLLEHGASVDSLDMTRLHFLEYHMNNKASGTLVVLAEFGSYPLGAGAVLRAAAAKGNARTVADMLRASDDADTILRLVNSVDDGGRSAVTHAAAAGRLDVIQLLAAAGATLDAADRRGRTALMEAADNGRDEVVAYLLAEIADRGHVHSRDDEGKTALHHAVRDGSCEVVNALTKAGASVRAGDAVNNTPLHDAAAYGDAATTQALISAAGDATAFDATNDDGDTPVHLAARAGKLDAFQTLVDAGAAVTGRNHAGWTPLMSAVIGGHLDIVSRLAATDVHAADNRGRTALHHAARRGFARGVVLLIERGYDVDGRDHAGRTPLHLAASVGCLEAVDALIVAGADVDAVDNDGCTVLLYAACRGQLQVCARLADCFEEDDVAGRAAMAPSRRAEHIGERDIAGRSALDFAAANEHDDVVAFLVAEGGQPTAMFGVGDL